MAETQVSIGECCHWMRVALTKYEQRSFAVSDDGLIEVWLGRTENEAEVVKSVLFCPFCGTKVPYKSRTN